MKTIHMVIELTYDEDLMHGDSEDGRRWFRMEVLGGPLVLHSNNIGDEVGPVKIISIEVNP